MFSPGDIVKLPNDDRCYKVIHTYVDGFDVKPVKYREPKELSKKMVQDNKILRRARTMCVDMDVSMNAIIKDIEERFSVTLSSKMRKTIRQMYIG